MLLVRLNMVFLRHLLFVEKGGKEGGRGEGKGESQSSNFERGFIPSPAQGREEGREGQRVRTSFFITSSTYDMPEHPPERTPILR